MSAGKVPLFAVQIQKSCRTDTSYSFEKMPYFIMLFSSLCPTGTGSPAAAPERRSPPGCRCAGHSETHWTPPPLMAADALLNVPGQRIPTEKPQTAQPSSPTNGTGTKTMHKYDAMHSTQLYFIKRARCSRSPNLP